MRTLFISFTINDGSVTDFFVLLSNKLSAYFKVVVITGKIERRPTGLNELITVYQWPSTRPTSVKDLWFLIKLIKQFRPSIMISMFGSVNMFLIAGFIMRVKHRIAWARTISSAFATTKMLMLRKRLVYKLSTMIFANSASTKKDLIDNFSVVSRKISVIPNAVKDQDITDETDNSQIVFVGRLHPSKGLDTLIDAMPAVVAEFPEIRLKIIGGGTRDNYQARAKAAGLERNIDFLGRLEKAQVIHELAKSYFSVVPSIVEAFGFVVIESFSVKTPVIGTNGSGVAEIITDGVDGFLFEPGNAKVLSEKMLLLLRDKNLRHKMSQECYSKFRLKYDLDTVVDQVAHKLIHI